MSQNTAAKPPTLKELIEAGWDYHDSESGRLAVELEAASKTVVDAGLLTGFLHLSNHTIGEHLEDWARAFRLANRVLHGRSIDGQSAGAWAALYVAAFLSGETIAAASAELQYLRFGDDDAATLLLKLRFALATALVGSRQLEAGSCVFRDALDLLGRIPHPAQLDRTIAVASNNIGWELYETSAGEPEAVALMQLCAETSLKHWRRCGNWINEERALYLKAVVLNATGDSQASLACADKALAIIESNAPRPLDSALLHLARASSFKAAGNVPSSVEAIASADAAASALTIDSLKQKFATERAGIADAL
jgi:hypothetical protein